ncbi:MAG: hypothetical protein BWZ07_02918 [Alphaproteobacteria bacterium ADurb.BinA280]|nr:MAG: hypothetical protein BWZ07_02918 [Alphaproteobacteria bacterium ADurb.BinA280]
MHHHRPVVERQRAQIRIVLGRHPSLYLVVRPFLQRLHERMDVLHGFRAMGIAQIVHAREDFAVLLGEFAPGFVCGCRARDRLNQLGNPFLHERVACLWVLNNPGLDPAWCSCWHKLNSQRVQGAIQEHRINDGLHIGVRKGNVDLGHVIGWRWFANARAFHAQIRQVAMPCILDHAQQRTLRG